MTTDDRSLRPTDLDYRLPAAQIALRPSERRAGSRLLYLAASGRFDDRIFGELPELLLPGDLLVVNDVQVPPMRLYGNKESGARVELLLLPGFDERRAGALLRCNGKLRVGEKILIGEEANALELVESLGRGAWTVCAPPGVPWSKLLQKHGKMPLPPYIERRRAADDADRVRYQTVYARHGQASAAPTAGFHFDRELLEALKTRGVEQESVCLQVGPGTFRPLDDELPLAEQALHSETWRIEPSVAAVVGAAVEQGRRIVAVGTTVLRTLEAWQMAGRPDDGEWRSTDVFLYPGKAPSFPLAALITNFHLPKSSLLALVCAFAGMGPVMEAYRHAVHADYRFYSYGDAMLVERA